MTASSEPSLELPRGTPSATETRVLGALIPWLEHPDQQAATYVDMLAHLRQLDDLKDISICRTTLGNWLNCALLHNTLSMSQSAGTQLVADACLASTTPLADAQILQIVTSAMLCCAAGANADVLHVASMQSVVWTALGSRSQGSQIVHRNAARTRVVATTVMAVSARHGVVAFQCTPMLAERVPIGPLVLDALQTVRSRGARRIVVSVDAAHMHELAAIPSVQCRAIGDGDVNLAAVVLELCKHQLHARGDESRGLMLAAGGGAWDDVLHRRSDVLLDLLTSQCTAMQELLSAVCF